MIYRGYEIKRCNYAGKPSEEGSYFGVYGKEGDFVADSVWTTEEKAMDFIDKLKRPRYP